MAHNLRKVIQNVPTLTFHGLYAMNGLYRHESFHSDPKEAEIRTAGRARYLSDKPAGSRIGDRLCIVS